MQSPDILERFRPYLLLLARSLIGAQLRRRVDPEDIVQETLLDALRGFDGFDGECFEQLRAWLRGCLKNRIRKVVRDHRRHRRDIRREQPLDLDQSSARLENLLAAQQSSPSQKVRREEAFLSACGALARLPDTFQQVVLLHDCEGWTFEEIGAALDIGRGAAFGVYRRALKRLRELLSGKE